MGKNSGRTKLKNGKAPARKDRVKKKKKEKKTWKSVKEKRNSVKSNVGDTPDDGVPKKTAPKPSSSASLRSRMLERLNVARFRHLNEESSKSVPLAELSEFKSYHEGFTQASSSWKTHPLDWIINYIGENVDDSKIVADFGCGNAKLQESIKQTTHSFDLHALNEQVTQCDVRNTPLDNEAVDLVVFCLSLMGCDVYDYVCEASRVLKNRGSLIIAETCSKVHKGFVGQMKRCGFKLLKNETLGNDLFQILVFEKLKRVIGKQTVTLNHTLYKKR